MYATPLAAVAIAFGQLAWIATRATLVGAIFALVIVLFGAAPTLGIVLAIPVGTLTALAFAAPIAAFMSTQRDTSTFNAIWRFGITPLFLFSGTFFPITQLPALHPAHRLAAAAVARRGPGAGARRWAPCGTTRSSTLAHLAILVASRSSGIVATVRHVLAAAGAVTP